MKRAIWFGATGTAIALGMLALGYLSGKPAMATADETPRVVKIASADTIDRKEVEAIIRDYLLENPEILIEVQRALDEKQEKEQRIAQLGVIEDARDEIYNSPYDAVVGNPEGKISIVEFYDYNCGFCKRAIQDMRDLTAENPDLRFVLKELPILGPDSQKAHVVSQAFHRLMPEKYAEFHNELLGGHARATEETAMKIALKLGADEATLRAEMKDPGILDVFTETYDLANKLSITGTPSYVVGNEVIFGALGKDVLAEKIVEAEACQTNANC